MSLVMGKLSALSRQIRSAGYMGQEHRKSSGDRVVSITGLYGSERGGCG